MLPQPPCRPQRDIMELLYRCARNGRPELHARFMPDPDVAAAFDELLAKDPRVKPHSSWRVPAGRTRLLVHACRDASHILCL